MSFEDFYHAWQYSEAKGTPLTILMSIAAYTDEHGVSWVGLDTIAKKARTAKRTVSRSIPALPINEIVSIEKAAGHYSRARNSAMSNLYIYLGNRPKEYVDTMLDLHEELKPYTPIYGGTKDSDQGIDKLSILLDYVSQHGKLTVDKPDQGVDNLSRRSSQVVQGGVDNLAQGIDNLSTDLNNDLKDFDLNKLIRFFSQVWEGRSYRYLVKEAQDQLGFMNFRDGILYLSYTPGRSHPEYYSTMLNTKAALNHAAVVFEEQVDEVAIIPQG